MLKSANPSLAVDRKMSEGGRVNSPERRNPEQERAAALTRLKHQLGALPIKDPREALVTCFGHALEKLGGEELMRLRARVVAHFGESHEFVELVDGHLAWRELRAGE